MSLLKSELLKIVSVNEHSPPLGQAAALIFNQNREFFFGEAKKE